MSEEQKNAEPVKKTDDARAEPPKRRSSIKMPDGRGGYRDACPWDEENERAKARDKQGECVSRCPNHPDRWCCRGKYPHQPAGTPATSALGYRNTNTNPVSVVAFSMTGAWIEKSKWTRNLTDGRAGEVPVPQSRAGRRRAGARLYPRKGGSARHAVNLMHHALEFILYEILQTAGHDVYKDGQNTIGINDAIDKCVKAKIDLPLIGIIRTIQKHRGTPSTTHRFPMSRPSQR